MQLCLYKSVVFMLTMQNLLRQRILRWRSCFDSAGR